MVSMITDQSNECCVPHRFESTVRSHWRPNFRDVVVIVGTSGKHTSLGLAFHPAFNTHRGWL